MATAGSDSSAHAGAIMTLPPRFSLLHSDPNDFLFALVGDQQNGMPLNVIPALTRLDIDPWAEAARLAALPNATGSRGPDADRRAIADRSRSSDKYRDQPSLGSAVADSEPSFHLKPGADHRLR
jgi:hypothetical protein